MSFPRIFQEARGVKGGGSASGGRYWFALSLSLLFFFNFFFMSVDTVVRDSEFVVPEGVVGSV